MGATKMMRSAKASGKTIGRKPSKAKPAVKLTRKTTECACYINHRLLVRDIEICLAWPGRLGSSGGAAAANGRKNRNRMATAIHR